MNFVLKIRRVLINSLSDKLYLQLVYYRNLKRILNLKRPKLFSEKLQWLKLYDRKDFYHNMVDKYEAKKFIVERVGEQNVIQTLGLWEEFEKIDFDILPDKFVLKCTHDSGSFYICKDKSNLDKEVLKRKLLRNFELDYFYNSREWPYKGIKARIIAEPLLEDPTCSYLRDYKFYCFNGEPKIFYITSDKGGDLPTRQDFFDITGKHLDIQDKHYTNNPQKTPDLPRNLDEMLRLARIFAKDTYHLRVDFYEIKNQVYVGEFTFFEGSGFCEFIPEKYNKLLGDWIHLPIDKE